jgi:hypothetical protein
MEMCLLFVGGGSFYFQKLIVAFLLDCGGSWRSGVRLGLAHDGLFEGGQECRRLGQAEEV